jgi:hypothetical protein
VVVLRVRLWFHPPDISSFCWNQPTSAFTHHVSSCSKCTPRQRLLGSHRRTFKSLRQVRDAHAELLYCLFCQKSPSSCITLLLCLLQFSTIVVFTQSYLLFFGSNCTISQMFVVVRLSFDHPWSIAGIETPMRDFDVRSRSNLN